MTQRPPVDVRTRREELGDLLLELLAVDTANPPGDTREIVDLIESWLAPLGVETERFAADPSTPNLLVTVSGERDRTLLFNGHLDTVPFDVDEYTTVDALLGNAAVYARLPAAWGDLVAS